MDGLFFGLLVGDAHPNVGVYCRGLRIFSNFLDPYSDLYFGDTFIVGLRIGNLWKLD